MVYGIISAKDNQTSLAFFKSKKVSQSNLVTADKLQQLVNVLSSGDVIHVVGQGDGSFVPLVLLATMNKLIGGMAYGTIKLRIYGICEKYKGS